MKIESDDLTAKDTVNRAALASQFLTWLSFPRTPPSAHFDGLRVFPNSQFATGVLAGIPYLAEVPSHAAVDTLRGILLDEAVVLEQVENTNKLGEYQDLVSLLFQLFHHLVKQHHLARVRDHLRATIKWSRAPTVRCHKWSLKGCVIICARP